MVKQNDKSNNQEEHKKEESCECEDRIKDLEDKYKRALADYQNLEKRTAEEKKDWIKLANKDLILRLLPSLDNLLLAAKHVEDKGLAISISQLIQTLKADGIEQIETVGKQFDPKKMECVEVVEAEENKVVEELRAGYTMYDTIIRPAAVKVGKSASRN